ncbi:flavodoxin domain-containing protein [Streptomyces kunmingensis]|uniref:Flavodoxin domain-containing protein n=1 Tax=Streptomyces kunmingensis TaxID=68225 RepID=A0ABU6CDA8_9ACTN|nr:flavodoxin domain-containing protein [Streptomyces kunmingensis]MEB3962692.1 flavodoxin domain-containing protein [Streptomyces kunmingensis]
MDGEQPRVLIVYASRNGSTAEIAGHISGVLSEAGCVATVCPAAEAGRDLDTYDAVVLGGALYTGRWHRAARRFARRFRRELETRPVWLFSSGPLDASASERDIPPVPGVRRLADRIEARGHATFGGRLNEDARGRVAKMIVKSGRGGDFRDLTQIISWAEGVARDIVPAPSGPGRA